MYKKKNATNSTTTTCDLIGYIIIIYNPYTG